MVARKNLAFCSCQNRIGDLVLLTISVPFNTQTHLAGTVSTENCQLFVGIWIIIESLSIWSWPYDLKVMLHVSFLHNNCLNTLFFLRYYIGPKFIGTISALLPYRPWLEVLLKYPPWTVESFAWPLPRWLAPVTRPASLARGCPWLRIRRREVTSSYDTPSNFPPRSTPSKRRW